MNKFGFGYFRVVEKSVRSGRVRVLKVGFGFRVPESITTLYVANFFASNSFKIITIFTVLLIGYDILTSVWHSTLLCTMVRTSWKINRADARHIVFFCRIIFDLEMHEQYY